MYTVIVYDPVSHCQFHWMQPSVQTQMPPDMRVAFVTCGPQTVRYKEVDFFRILSDRNPDGTRTCGDTTTKTEHLAPVNVDGLTIERLRISHSQPGGDGQAKEWSTETWYSPELHEIVREGSKQEGYSGFVNVQRTDPDSKLFYPPNGYRIQLETSK